MGQLHFITKLLDIKDPNIKILDIINMDTHKEIIAKLDYEAPSCPDCGSLLRKILIILILSLFLKAEHKLSSEITFFATIEPFVVK
ncbi:transposase [Streptococcus pneumoniae]|nr:transposase [Streptococcus pneumoniae]